MNDAFDPYHKWLGIPPAEQPPNLYRLLGITAFEEDTDAIDSAADRQMTHLRSYQNGPHSALSQRLLNECAAARHCLLTADKKAEYDRQLFAKLRPPPPRLAPFAPLPPPVAIRPVVSLPVAGAVIAKPVAVAIDTTLESEVPTRPFGSLPRMVAVTLGVTLCSLALFLLIFGTRERPLSTAKPGPSSSTPEITGEAPLADDDAQRSETAVATTDDSSTSAAPRDGGSETTPPFVAGQPIDLLKLIDPERDAIEGFWKFDGGAIVCHADGYGRLQTRIAPPPEYQLDLELERTAGEDVFSLGLVARTKPFHLFIDGNGKRMTGVWSVQDNWCVAEATHNGAVLQNGRRSKFVCTVRGDRLTLVCDGRPLLDWAGDYSQAGMHSGVATPDPTVITLGLWGGTFRVHQLVLTPLSEASPPAEAASVSTNNPPRPVEPKGDADKPKAPPPEPPAEEPDEEEVSLDSEGPSRTAPEFYSITPGEAAAGDTVRFKGRRLQKTRMVVFAVGHTTKLAAFHVVSDRELDVVVPDYYLPGATAVVAILTAHGVTVGSPPSAVQVDANSRQDTSSAQFHHVHKDGRLRQATSVCVIDEGGVVDRASGAGMIFVKRGGLLDEFRKSSGVIFEEPGAVFGKAPNGKGQNVYDKRLKRIKVPRIEVSPGVEEFVFKSPPHAPGTAASPPNIDSIRPPQAGYADLITLNGRGFFETSDVFFDRGNGGLINAGFKVISNRQLQVVVPDRAGRGHEVVIVVVNPKGLTVTLPPRLRTGRSLDARGGWFLPKEDGQWSNSSGASVQLVQSGQAIAKGTDLAFIKSGGRFGPYGARVVFFEPGADIPDGARKAKTSFPVEQIVPSELNLFRIELP